MEPVWNPLGIRLESGGIRSYCCGIRCFSDFCNALFSNEYGTACRAQLFAFILLELHHNWRRMGLDPWTFPCSPALAIPFRILRTTIFMDFGLGETLRKKMRRRWKQNPQYNCTDNDQGSTPPNPTRKKKANANLSTLFDPA
jgi:hypothetical protein